MERYLSLQWLRALAAWMVVFHHYMQLIRDFQPQSLIGKFFTYHGSLGVDIFFVLSGFIMAHSILRRQPGAISFLWDRITRIVPAYWLATIVLLIVLVGAEGENLAYLKGSGWLELLYSFLFIPHEHASGLGIFPVLTVGWTLNFEMFFYLILGLSLVIYRQWAIWIGMVIVIALPLVSLRGIDLGFVASDFLIYEFAFGLLLYLILRGSRPFLEGESLLRWGLAAGFLGLAMTSLVVKIPHANMVLAVSAVAGFVLADDIFSRLSAGPGWFFVHLGNLSYSTYLLHIPALILISRWMDISPGNDLLLVPASAGLTYLMSWISFVYVEGRLRGWSKGLFKPAN